MNVDKIVDEVRGYAGPQRAESFAMVAKMIISQGLKMFVETGTYRGNDADGQSTRIFATLARSQDGSFDSVDINSSHLAQARKMLNTNILDARLICEDSVTFLSNRETPIDVLYLDSFDFEEKNPQPSQRHQLAELGAAYGKLGENSIVLLDDCNLPHGGKALLSAAFLLDCGWKQVYDCYQKVFVR